MNKYFRSIAVLFVAACIAAPAFAQGPFDSTANWGPRGTANTPGEVEYDDASGTFTMRGNGDDIWNNDDEGFFVYANKSGSWRISANVYWNDPGTNDWSKIGVMVRENAEDASSRHYWAELRGAGFGDRVDAQWRDSTGGGSGNAQIFEEDGTTGVFDIFNEGVWIRVSRYAALDLFVTEWSYDGENWVIGHQQNQADWPDEVAFGLAITSHVDDEFLVEARVTDVVLEEIPDVVAITRSFDATSFLPGQDIGVTLNLFNPSADAVNLTITETSPFAASTISDGGSASGNTITWNFSAPSGSSSISYTASVPANYDTASSGYGATWSGTDGSLDIQGKNSLFLIDFGPGEEIVSYDFEDASQLDAWTDLAGFFDIESGQLMELEDAGGPLVTLADGSYSDVAVSVDATGLVGDADWGIVFRATDLQNFYSFQFVNGALELLEYVAGARATIYNQAFAEELGVVQKYQIVARGTVIQLWFNGEVVAIVEDDSLTEGQVGLFTWVNAGTDLSATIGGTAFDNFVVSSVAGATDVNNWSLY